MPVASRFTFGFIESSGISVLALALNLEVYAVVGISHDFMEIGGVPLFALLYNVKKTSFKGLFNHGFIELCSTPLFALLKYEDAHVWRLRPWSH